MKTFLLIYAISGFLGVALGAFGAHALEAHLKATGRLPTWDTAVLYQFVHTIALLGVAILVKSFGPDPMLRWSGIAFIAGIVIFSGSLYALSLSGIRMLGAITPLGGLAFLAGWALIAIWAMKQS